PANVSITGSDSGATDATSADNVAMLTNRDASTANEALTNVLTLQQAQELKAEQEKARENQIAANYIGAVVTNVIGDVAQSQGWPDGSWQKTALHGVAGLIQAEVAGTDPAKAVVAAMLNEQMLPVLEEYLNSQGITPDDPRTEQDFKSLMTAASTLLGAAFDAASVTHTATVNNYLTHLQARDKQRRLTDAKSTAEREEVIEEYAELEKRQEETAAACLIKDQCASVFEKPSLRATLDELIAACSTPRMCTSEEKRSIVELQGFYAEREAISPDTTIEEFLLANKLLGAAFTSAQALGVRLLEGSTSTLAKPLGVVEDFGGNAVRAFEAPAQYAFKAEVDIMKTGANLESSALQFVKDEAGKDLIAVFDSKIGAQGIDLAYAKMVNGKPQLVIGEAKAGDSVLTALGENNVKTLQRNLGVIEKSILAMPRSPARSALLEQIRDKSYVVELYTTTGNAAKAAGRIDDVLLNRLENSVSRVVTFTRN
ncbi:hypothetical protein, partial [Hydrogenophaga sp.]|uniref:hypothetical protein n=1 Tax=Hydrogenophaga sp. TaxID=1904254 RepID=UPI002FCAB13C